MTAVIIFVIACYEFLFDYRNSYCAISVIYLKKTFVQYQTPTFCIPLARVLVRLRMRFDEGLLHVVHVYPLHSKYELGTRYAHRVFVLTLN